VLIVDDSPVMQRLIASTLTKDPRIEIAAMASDAAEARSLIKQTEPDVLTLDVEMPGMSGIEFLRRLQKLRPMPVIMVSTLTSRGTSTALEAMALGAIDCVCKPTGKPGDEGFTGLADKVVAAADSKRSILAQAAMAGARPPSATPDKPYRPNSKILLIGASTGGVPALTAVLSHFPENCPPTLIVQHMPHGFTRNFASRLNQTCAPNVREAAHGDMIKPGTVLIAPGGERHLSITGRRHFACALTEGEPVTGHRPSVDVLFDSAASIADRTVGLIMTGMGADGAAGLKTLRQAGARTIVQDEATSAVYGMPRAAYEMGAAERVLPLDRIAENVLEECAHAR
jgi:two-component system chemotaxis response regulator CheB